MQLNVLDDLAEAMKALDGKKQLYAVVRSKGANSWSKVRSPLLVLNAITVHG